PGRERGDTADRPWLAVPSPAAAQVSCVRGRPEPGRDLLHGRHHGVPQGRRPHTGGHREESARPPAGGGIGRDGRLLLVTPLAHAAGLFTLAGLPRGSYVRIEPGFDAQAVLDRLNGDRITWTFAVPTIARAAGVARGPVV